MTGAPRRLRRWQPVAACLLAFVALLGVVIPASAAGSEQQIPGESWIVTFGGDVSVDTPRRALSEARDRTLDRATDRALARLRITPTQRYRRAVHGFAALLTPAQVRALSRDPTVRSITTDRQMTIDDALPPRASGVDATQAGGIRTVNITS